MRFRIIRDQPHREQWPCLGLIVAQSVAIITRQGFEDLEVGGERTLVVAHTHYLFSYFLMIDQGTVSTLSYSALARSILYPPHPKSIQNSHFLPVDSSCCCC